ncbi:MAG: transporter [Polyangiaceae bacterium]
MPSGSKAGLCVAALLATAPAWSAEVEAEEGELAGYTEAVAFEEVLPEAAPEVALRLSVEAMRSAEPSVDAGPDRYLLPRMQLFYGITRRLGGEIEVPMVLRREGSDSAYGFGDLGAGLKLAVIQTDSAALVLSGEVSIPTGDPERELGEGKGEFETGLGGVAVFHPFVLQARAGFMLTTAEIETAFFHATSLGVEVVDERLVLYAEAMGEVSFGEEGTVLSAGPSAKLHLSSDTFVALGGQVGLTDEADQYRLIAQVQHEF